MSTGNAQVRMLSQGERAIRIMLARAGVSSFHDLALLVKASHPDLADETTIYRYLKGRTRRRAYPLVKAMAEELGVPPDELEEALDLVAKGRYRHAATSDPQVRARLVAALGM